MRLSRQSRNTESRDHTLESLTLGNTDGVDVLVLAEHVADLDLLFEKIQTEVNLIGDRSSVHLDLLDHTLLLLDLALLNLGVADGTDGCTELLGPLDLSLHRGTTFPLHLLPPLLITGESLLLALVPVLVESPLASITQVTSEHAGEWPQAIRGLDVTDETDAYNWRGLQEGDGLADLLLVKPGARSLHVTDDVSHSDLVTHEAGQVRRLGLIILWPRLHLTVMMLRLHSWREGQASVSWAFELSVRHLSDAGN